MRRIEKLAGAGTGMLSGILLALFLPSAAQWCGRDVSTLTSLFTIFIVSGAALGFLLQRLLHWAGGTRREILLGATLPWLATLLLWLLLLVPGGKMVTVESVLGNSQYVWTESPYLSGHTFGSMLGPVKYALSAAYIAAVGVFASFLLRPLLREFHPLRLTAGFFTLCVLLSVSLAVQPPVESDEGDYVLLSIALAQTGTTRVDEVFFKEFDSYYKGWYPGSLRLYQYLVGDRHYIPYHYSLRMTGYPLLLAPFIKAAGRCEDSYFRWLISYLPGIAGYGLLVLGASLWLDRHGNKNRLALAAFATMTPFLYFPTNTQPEIWMAAGVMGALLLSEKTSSPFLFGLLAGALPLLHERMVVFTAVFLLHGLWKSKERGRLIAGAVLAGAAVVLSYASVLQFKMPGQMPHAYGDPKIHFIDPGRWGRALIAHLVSPNIGLLARVPPLIALFFIPWKKIGSNLRLSFVAFGLYFLLIVTYPHGFDSWPHLRYFVPALPLLLPGLAAGTERMESMRGGRSAFVFLLLLQAAISWPFLTAPQLWRVFN